MMTGTTAAVGAGLVTIGAGLGIGKLAASAMEGIARVTPSLNPGDVQSISVAIDNDYHGAGQAFNEFCAKAQGS